MSSYEKRHPGFPAKAYEEMRKKHSPPLTQAKAAKALELYRAGHLRENVATILKVSECAIELSMKWDAEFKREWKKITQRRCAQVEKRFVRSLLKGNKEVRITKVPVLDDDGEPVIYNGKQQFRTTQKQIIIKPAGNDALIFYLKTLSDRFKGTKEEESTLLPIEELKQAIAQLAAHVLPRTDQPIISIVQP